MQDQVGEDGLLERCLECLDQLVRELLDEADRVGEQVIAARQLEAARGRVEGVEEPVPDPYLGARQRVEEGRLAGVRVAGQRHPRQRGALAPGPHHAPVALEPGQPPAQGGDAVAGEPPIGLDLALARAPGADPAVHPARAEALEMGPQPAHASQVVLELGQLDLELALGRVGVVGEDVEDHRRAVDHRDPERRLEVALLARRQLVIAGDQVGVEGGDLRLQLARACRGRNSGRDRAAERCWVVSPAVATPAVRSSSLSSARGSSASLSVDDPDRQRPLARPPVRDAGAVAGIAALRGAPVSRSVHSPTV